MHIVIFSEVFWPKVGGMERFAEDMADCWHRLGAVVTLVTDTKLNSELKDTFPFSVVRLANLSDKLRLMRSSDVVLFVGITFENIVLTYLCSKPIFVSHHNAYIYSSKHIAVIKGTIKKILTRPYRNISVSHFLANKIGGNHKIIMNGYDNLRFHRGSLAKPYSFAFCGRLVSDKGCIELLNAFEMVKRQFSDATLTYIGDGEERVKLSKLAEELNLLDSICFQGMLSPGEVAQELRRHICLVVPSIWEEPFGIVVLEGLASGCELIVSNRGGLPEALAGFGQTVDPDPVAISRAMVSVCESQKKIDQLELNNYLKQREVMNVAETYLNYFKSCLNL